MEMIKDFFKKKGIGFYLIVVSAILALILGIMFFALYQAPNGDGQKNMANGAYGAIPEVIGIFALVGFALEISAILVPEIALIHVGALVCYCISFGKMVYTIADVFAGLYTGIAYEGGNPPLLITWMVMQIVMILASIVAVFMGQDKKAVALEGEEVAENA